MAGSDRATAAALLRVREVFWPSTAEANAADRIFRLFTALFGIAVVLVLAVMTLEMLDASALSIQKFGLSFLTSTDWDPVHDQFGALAFIFGTLFSSALALALAVPVALAIAILLTELAPRWIRAPLGFLVELLAAIPSVIYGLWGIFVLAPWLRGTVEPLLARYLGFLPLFKGTMSGFGMLTGGMILAIMILPTIASVSRDVMRAVPDTQREGALALGATRWEMVRMAVMPYVRSGLVGAIILGLGRALGETMAITMVIGNTADISWSLFHPGATMASVIANEYTEAASDLYLSALSEIGLLLFGVTLLLNIFARLLVWKVSKVKAVRV